MSFLESVQFLLEFILNFGKKIFHWVITTEPINYFCASFLLIGIIRIIFLIRNDIAFAKRGDLD